MMNSINEKRLIDANEAKKIAREHLSNPYEIISTCAVLDRTPTVDAVEVVHGRWNNKQTNSIFTWHLECSVCGADYNTTVGYNYCPNCGAKMDGEKSDE